MIGWKKCRNENQIISNQSNSVVGNSIISISTNYTSRIYQFKNLPEPKNATEGNYILN